ncbi:hypothetical protein AFLA_006020 [Aspergillus flavus NRRL3357]|nr:hypothetical protein AFLA_006020 [Aspergillus flavus NRRL3357]
MARGWAAFSHMTLYTVCTETYGVKVLHPSDVMCMLCAIPYQSNPTRTFDGLAMTPIVHQLHLFKRKSMSPRRMWYDSPLTSRIMIGKNILTLEFERMGA